MTPEDLEQHFDRRAKQIQPWIEQADETGEQAAWQAVLGRKAGAQFGQRCYVAPDANVFTHSLVLGDGSWVAAGAILRGHLRIGSRTSVNPYAHIAGNVVIGSAVMIASLASIYGFNHGFERTDVLMRDQPLSHKGVVIGDDSWIGANAVILDGVTLGRGCIVAAGAVVTRSAPEYSVIAGNPGRVIADRRARSASPGTE